MRLACCLAVVGSLCVAAACMGAQTVNDLLPAYESGSPSAYSADGKVFVMATPDLAVFDAPTHRFLKRVVVGDNPARAAALSADGKIAAVSMANLVAETAPGLVGEDLVVVDVAAGKVVNRFAGMSTGTNIRRLSLSPDGKLVMTSNAEGINVYEVATGKVTWEYRQDRNANGTWSYAGAVATPDWKYFFHNSQRVSYPAREVSTPLVFDEKEKRQSYRDNLMSADGKLAALCGGINGRDQRIFEIETGKLVRECRRFAADMIGGSSDLSVIFTPEGYWTADKQVEVRIEAFAKVCARPDGKEVTVNQVRYATETFATTAPFGTTHDRWGGGYTAIKAGPRAGQWIYGTHAIDVNVGKLGSLPVDAGKAPDVLVHRDEFGDFPKVHSPDQLTRIVAGGDIYRRAHNKENFPGEPEGNLFASLTPKLSRAQMVFLSANLVAALTQDTFYVVNYPAKKIVLTAPYTPVTLESTNYQGKPYKVVPHYRWLISLQKGKRLLVIQGSWESSFRYYARCFDTATGKQVGETVMFAGHGRIVPEVTAAPDDRHVALPSGKSALILDGQSGKVVATPQVAFGLVGKVAFSADSSQIALSTAGHVEFFALPTARRLATAAAEYMPRKQPFDPVQTAIVLFNAEGKAVAGLGDPLVLFGPPRK